MLQTDRLDDGLFRTLAPNGVTVLTESMPTVRSVAVGIWVRTASAHEDRAKMGISHMLEHMVFKGTDRRSARDIALELETRGGSLDAFTSRDHTSYQARVLDADLPHALDVLTDLVRNPALRERDLVLERNVVLEEISTVDDTPDDLVFDLHAAELWPEHPYGFSILGTRETVSALEAPDLHALHARAYHPQHVVIAAAGNVDHELLLRLLTKCGWFEYPPGPDPVPVPPVPASRRTNRMVPRDTAQSHIVIGTGTFPYRDRRRHALVLLNTVLGGGMSSRLFQRIREELGLAYAVFSFQAFYRECGLTGVYVGSHPDTAPQAVEAIHQELARLAEAGLPPGELQAAKQQLAGQVTLSLESPSARMHRLAGFPLNDEAFRTLDQTLRDITAVTADDIATVAAEFLSPDRQTTVWLGPN